MFVYVICGGEFRKIGSSSFDPDKRRREMQPSCPFPLSVEYARECTVDEAFRVEVNVHQVLAGRCAVGEWFRVTKEEAVFAVERAMSQATEETLRRRTHAAITAGRASARTKKARTAAALDKIRERWRDRDYTVDQLSEESGLSRRTLYNELGPRFEDAGTEHA